MKDNIEILAKKLKEKALEEDNYLNYMSLMQTLLLLPN